LRIFRLFAVGLFYHIFGIMLDIKLSLCKEFFLNPWSLRTPWTSTIFSSSFDDLCRKDWVSLQEIMAQTDNTFGKNNANPWQWMKKNKMRENQDGLVGETHVFVENKSERIPQRFCTWFCISACSLMPIKIIISTN